MMIRAASLGPKLVVVMALATVSGCLSVGAQAQGGYAMPTSSVDGHDSATVELRGGMYSGLGMTEVGGMFALRGKLGSALQQVQLGPDLTVVAWADNPVAPYLRGGLAAFQFEQVDDRFGFGMFSPYGEIGLRFGLARSFQRGLYLNVGVTAEYDVRFTSQPNRGYWGLVVGLGGWSFRNPVPSQVREMVSAGD